VTTDRRPARGKAREEYDASSRLTEIAVPPLGSLVSMFDSLETAREAEERHALHGVCEGLLARLSGFYGIVPPGVKLHGVRPHRTREGRLSTELLGDYDFDSAGIRLWTRTAIHRKWTSSRTILSTLCHEFMHHLDAVHLGFPSSYHTVGFFERTHRIYLSVTGQPYYALAWSLAQANGSRTIDWPETNRRKRGIREAG
jgi:hypothetical protein